MKTLTLAEIEQLSARELIEGLESGKFSLLKSLGATRLRLAMKPIGWACRFVLWLVLLGGGNKTQKDWRQKRAKAARIVKFFFPDSFEGEVADAQALVVGFNHPTLHEILSLVAWSLERFPDRHNNFPTNLPWYESICTCAGTLRKISIHITPLITPSTLGKLKIVCADNPAAINVIEGIQKSFTNRYAELAVEFARAGHNTFAAPSTTRQATIFASQADFAGTPGEKRPPRAMTFLLYYLKRSSASLTFLPVLVLPPAKYSTRLNVFRRYHLVVKTGFPMSEAWACRKDFDHAFLLRLAESAPPELIYPKP